MDASAVLANVVEGAESVGRGGNSNTPPQTLQHAQDVQEISSGTGGEDWFEVMLYLQWSPGTEERLFRLLDEIQEDVKHDRLTEPFVSLPGSGGLWKIRSKTTRLGGSGKGKVGEKEKGPMISWIIERDGVTFGFCRKMDPHETSPSGFVRMTGETLMAAAGAFGLWELCVKWLAELGATVEGTRVSRVDMAIDMPGMSVAPFVAAYREGRVVSKLKRSQEEGFTTLFRMGRKDTGVRMGSGTLLRIYDKSEECRDIAKRAWLIHSRWGGVDQESATRVEFQLRTEFLRAKKCKVHGGGFIHRPPIVTVEDYFQNRAELAEYLTAEWVRFVEAFDEQHTERATMLPEWIQVRDAFKAWTGAPLVSKFRPLPRTLVDTSALAKQVRGCMETAAAHKRMSVPDERVLLMIVQNQLKSVLNGPEAIARIRGKLLEQVAWRVTQAVEDLSCRLECGEITEDGFVDFAMDEVYEVIVGDDSIGRRVAARTNTVGELTGACT